MGADRAHVGDGQQQQQAQPFRALHHGDEVGDGPRVVDIAFERRTGHQKVLADQPGGRFRFLVGQTETRPQLQRDLGAQFRMVPVPALGDVMQEHAEIKRAARFDRMDDFGGDRHVFRQAAFFDAMQDADGLHGVLVDRVDMVHIVLHLGDDAAEVGHEAAEHAGFVHMAERHLGILAGRQHVEEQAIGLGILPHFVVDPLQIARNQRQSARMDVEIVVERCGEQLDHLDRRRLEIGLLHDVQATVFDAEAIGLFQAGTDRESETSIYASGCLPAGRR